METAMPDPTPQRLPVVHALIWRATQPDATFDGAEFERRIPRLMTWLRGLHAAGKLVACGGGGFATHSGGLTLVRADSVEEAQRLATESPMNEIGSTDVLVWDVYFGKLDVPREWTPKSV
jgi:uncharacterized protein YciI